MKRVALLSCALAALSAPSFARAQTPGDVTLASATSLGAEANGQSKEAAVSADGRIVAFESDATDLVPNDTNGNSDVFVRDRETDVVQRVSVTSSGAQVAGDSTCPALSADGRYVAFQSRAVALVPGATGIRRPMVYVHDRQDGSTVRVSVAADGGLPDFDSGCPSISGDGQRIVFASYARNLLPTQSDRDLDVYLYDRTTRTTVRVSESVSGGEANSSSSGPKISRDGRFVAFESAATDLIPAAQLPIPRSFADTVPHVYVRDLERHVTELVSVAAAHPLTAPDRASYTPSVSADGRYVAFRSTATNIAPVSGRSYDNIFVRDRVTRETWLASPEDDLQSDCGRNGQSFGCLDGTRGPPSLSDDGRFVAFSSRSLRHLPANTWHGDQIYLFDNLGRRLRRLSVDATGAEGQACSWKPALSADGRVLAYATKSILVPNDTGVDVDVLAQEWTCTGGVCRTLAACPAEPRSCAAADGSLLRLRKHAPGATRPDELDWRWQGADSGVAFPDPTRDAAYQLCVYARTLVLDAAAPQAPRCSGDARPCWRGFASGYKLIDPAGALASVILSGGPEGRRIHVRGGGAALDAPYLPVDGSKGIVVQLQDTTSGRCYGANFPASAIRRNVAGTATGGRGGDGWLIAEIAPGAQP